MIISSTLLFLEEIFGKKVDLLTPEGISPHLKSYIMEQIQEILKDEQRKEEYE